MPRPAVVVARKAAAPPATTAKVLSAVILPVAATESTDMAGPIVEVVVTAPVVELTEIVWKPPCERTGPLKVEFAIIKSFVL
jgi:hypothetical protein